MNNAIQKYGWENFDHEIVASGLTQDEACHMEQLLIRELKTCDPEYGYNILEGGLAPHQTDDTKRRIGEAQKGKPKPDNVAYKMQQAQMNPATKAKISAALKGRKYVASGKQRALPQHRTVRCIETGEIFQTIKSAADTMGACPSAIKKCCDGRGRSSGGFTWEYV